MQARAYADAEPSLRRVIALSPASCEGYGALGRTLEARGGTSDNWQEAVKMFRQEVNPDGCRHQR